MLSGEEVHILWGLLVLSIYFPILSRKIPAHLKVTTRLFSRIISRPVAGFLPFRGAFSLTWNFPNPDIITSSPDAKVDFMISRRISIVSFASEGDWLISSEIFSMIICLVIADKGCVLLFWLAWDNCFS